MKVFIPLFMALMIITVFPVAPCRAAGGPFTYMELNRFLDDWPDFLELAAEEDLALMTTPLAENDDVQDWAEDNDWDVHRFFTIEQRLRTAIAAARLKQEKDREIGLMKQQINLYMRDDNRTEEQKAALTANMRRAIKEAELAPYGSGTTETELNMIEGNEDFYAEILSGRAKMPTQ